MEKKINRDYFKYLQQLIQFVITEWNWAMNSQLTYQANRENGRRESPD